MRFLKSFSFSIFFLAAFFFASSHEADVIVQNNCPYTVWAAAGGPNITGGGKQLQPGEPWFITFPPGSTGSGYRIWARTNCIFDEAGRGKCETGDCDGLLECKGYGSPPNTLIEYAFNLVNNMDFFDISLVDGFNVPVEFNAVSSGCNNGTRTRSIKCTADINQQCPDELRAPGGCNNACTVFQTDEYCCISGPSNCNSTNYSRFFKNRCPDAYSYSYDYATSTFTCPGGTNYMVVFCPRTSTSTNLKITYNLVCT